MQDRLHFLAARVPELMSSAIASQLRLTGNAGGGAPAGGGRTVRFFYDFASPWAYIASTQIRRIAAAHGARVEYVPLLLGALFKAIGTPNVPMAVRAHGARARDCVLRAHDARGVRAFARACAHACGCAGATPVRAPLPLPDVSACSQTMPPARLAYGSRDMDDWLAWWGLGPADFFFTSHFPLRTVTAQRVAILVRCAAAVCTTAHAQCEPPCLRTGPTGN